MPLSTRLRDFVEDVIFQRDPFQRGLTSVNREPARTQPGAEIAFSLGADLDTNTRKARSVRGARQGKVQNAPGKEVLPLQQETMRAES
jgi:hypothetical protein